jgi:hypothetical protein
LSHYSSHLSALIDAPFLAVERAYSEAVEEFILAAASTQGLNYRLRTWFLLLVYDGINLYCREARIPTLTSFDPECLERMLSRHLPLSVASAVRQALSQIHDYRLKYFLNKEARIRADVATETLVALSGEV